MEKQNEVIEEVALKSIEEGTKSIGTLAKVGIIGGAATIGVIASYELVERVVKPVAKRVKKRFTEAKERRQSKKSEINISEE